MPARQAPKPDEAEQLRELIREAHEVLRDLKAEAKAAKELVAGLVSDVIVEQVGDQFSSLQRAVDRKQTQAEKEIMAEFEVLRTEYMLKKEKDLPTIEEFMICQKVIEFIMTKVKDTDRTAGATVMMEIVPPGAKARRPIPDMDLDVSGLSLRSTDTIAHIKVRPKEDAS